MVDIAWSVLIGALVLSGLLFWGFLITVFVMICLGDKE